MIDTRQEKTVVIVVEKKIALVIVVVAKIKRLYRTKKNQKTKVVHRKQKKTVIKVTRVIHRQKTQKPTMITENLKAVTIRKVAKRANINQALVNLVAINLKMRNQRKTIVKIVMMA